MSDPDRSVRRNRLYSSSGIFDYFHQFFSISRLPARLAMAAFFLVFLIVPMIGGPGRGTAGSFESGIVFFGLNLVFYTASMIILRFNRRQVDPRLKRSGKVVLAMISGSISLYSLAAVLGLFLGNEVISVLRVSSSIVIIVPLVLVITLLVESVIRRGIVQNDSRVPLGLVFMTILLIMYTFATVYFVNGLLIKVDVLTGSTTTLVNFEDALYFSGLIFTTLGSADIYPLGIGKGVMLFESVSGYLVLGFLTAIFIQAIITARENGRT